MSVARIYLHGKAYLYVSPTEVTNLQKSCAHLSSESWAAIKVQNKTICPGNMLQNCVLETWKAASGYIADCPMANKEKLFSHVE